MSQCEGNSKKMMDQIRATAHSQRQSLSLRSPQRRAELSNLNIRYALAERGRYNSPPLRQSDAFNPTKQKQSNIPLFAYIRRIQLLHTLFTVSNYVQAWEKPAPTHTFSLAPLFPPAICRFPRNQNREPLFSLAPDPTSTATTRYTSMKR